MTKTGIALESGNPSNKRHIAWMETCYIFSNYCLQETGLPVSSQVVPRPKISIFSNPSAR